MPQTGGPSQQLESLVLYSILLMKTPPTSAERGRRKRRTPSSSITTLFFCPLCSFKTTREGMKEGTAAKHLKEEHRVTGAMMMNSPSGTYHFRKVRKTMPMMPIFSWTLQNSKIEPGNITRIAQCEPRVTTVWLQAPPARIHRPTRSWSFNYWKYFKIIFKLSVIPGAPISAATMIDNIV